MANITYYHKDKISIESKLTKFFIGLFMMKKAMEKKITNNKYKKKPANIPKSIIKKFNIEIEEFCNRKVWTLSTKNNKNNTIILFLHGGVYYANITKMHWQFIEQILEKTNTTIIIPDYPLAPESTYIETYKLLDLVYTSIISNHPNKQIVFMGDSAGGGLALGFAQKIRNEGLKQPEKIIMFSPWLDVSMTNPEIEIIDKTDKILNVTGLKIAGKKYAGDLNIKNFQISPIYGYFENLGEISIFIGTNEVFIADARKFKQILKTQNICINYFEYPKMFHDWVIIKTLPESKDVIDKICKILK